MYEEERPQEDIPFLQVRVTHPSTFLEVSCVVRVPDMEPSTKRVPARGLPLGRPEKRSKGTDACHSWPSDNQLLKGFCETSLFTCGS